MSNIKILFAGAPEGDWAGLFKKVDTLNKKNGPFNALFCVGQFFRKCCSHTQVTSHDIVNPAPRTSCMVTCPPTLPPPPTRRRSAPRLR